MGRMNCTADEAYLILRLHAAETGTPLSTAATALITRRSGP
jgi:AmiR/NasT family two-component response regulator